MLKRAREALKPTNAIELSPAATTLRPATGTPAADPDSVRRRYYAQDHGAERRYFEDYQGKTLAFRAGAERLSSKREDLNTIRSMLDLAEARGWREVSLKGTAAFRREAWIEAAARVLPAQGPRASDLDRQEADRRRAARQPARQPTAVPQAPAAPPSSAPSAQQSRPAENGLSPDAQLVLRAIEAKIDASMRKLTDEAKAELKAFAAAELARRERRDGQVVLPSRQRGPPASVRLVEPRQPVPAAVPREPEQPEQRQARRR